MLEMLYKAQQIGLLLVLIWPNHGSKIHMPIVQITKTIRLGNVWKSGHCAYSIARSKILVCSNSLKAPYWAQRTVADTFHDTESPL
jgi:hypothetical protein